MACNDYDKIIENLYLGSVWLPLTSPDILKNMGITHIIDLTSKSEFKNLKHKPKVFKYLTLEIEDNKESCKNLRNNFNKLHNFIEEGLKNGKVYVHCNCGVSRSATVIISFLMNKKKYSLKDAYALVKTKRDIIQPKIPFIEILRDYELYLFKKSTLSIEEYMQLNS